MATLKMWLRVFRNTFLMCGSYLLIGYIIGLFQREFEPPPMALLWMLTVLGAAAVLVSGLDTIVTALTTAITAALTEGARAREAQAQQRDDRRQEHWRERHRHTHPQCAQCKIDEEDGLGIFRR